MKSLPKQQKMLLEDVYNSWLYTTSITAVNSKVFKISENYDNVNVHTEFIKTKAFKKAKNVIKKKHEKHMSNIKFSYAKNLYDDGGNTQIVFRKKIFKK